MVQRLRRETRLRHMAIKTEQAYAQWVSRFIRRYSIPDDSTWEEMNGGHVRTFLTELAVEGNVAASTRSEAVAVRCRSIEETRATAGGVERRGNRAGFSGTQRTSRRPDRRDFRVQGAQRVRMV
jgi:hypothetical protein